MQKLKLEGVRNIRDLGGLKTLEGKSVRENHFLRAGHLHTITESDMKILVEKYHLKTIIDLRTKQEIKEKPDKEIDGVKYISIPLINETTAGISREKGSDPKSIAKDYNDKAELLAAIPDMSKIYLFMVTDKNAIDQIKKVMSVLMNQNDGAVLFHCTAGKDRTGIIAALLLYLLGVSEKDIYADYLITNKSVRKEALKYYWIALLLKHDRKIAAKLKRVYIADKTYLQSAFEAIDKTYESRSNFIRDALEIDEVNIENWKRKVLI